MKLFHSRLTKRYVIIVLVVILFVLTSLFTVAVYVMNASVRSQMEYRDELLTKTLGAQIETVLQHAIADMRQVSPVLETIENTSKSTYQKEIEKIISQDLLYLFIEIYQENDQSLRIPNVPLAGSAPINAVLERLSWSKTSYISNLIELPDGRKTIVIAYPSTNEQGDYAGAVIAYLNLSILSDHLQKFAIGQEGMNALVDRNGTIVAHTNKDYIGKSIQNHKVGLNLEKERYGLWNGNIFEEQMVVAYRPLLLGNISLIAGEPIKQALTPARPVTDLLIKGFIMVFIIALGLAVFSASRVVRPVMALINQVQDYKEGKRKAFHIVHTNDEIEDLSLVLSEMATELREKERSMFYILESIPYCVITTDQDGRIMTFNKGAEELMLYNREEVLGKSIFDLPIKHNIHEFVLLKTLKEGKSFEEVESYIIDKQKQTHDVRIYTSLFKGEQNEYIGSLLVIRDVSERKKLEEFLRQSERLASLGQLTAGIAHEIKNPLSIIQVAAETIRLQIDDRLEDKEIIDELTDDILVSSERMNKLLTNFLKLTKDDVHNDVSFTDLISVTDEILTLLRKKFSEQDVKVTTDYKTNRAVVKGNRHKLSQMLLNVLLNGLQAMKNGGAIQVTIRGEADFWQLSVSDTGEGIPEDKLKWIFNPFYSTKPEGTGLGLSIAHEITVQHSGKVWAESIINKGTTIYFQLPKGE
ncbi:PAS domain-containing sensor histidine kinase [Peribacillus cavernae]|nr:PAS domain-containing sensor histidine kinase [Peribacillus cavernae]MDQ0217684.1 PAS domain S-box-containing protein [Peribacillus cavernae]